LSDNEDDDNAMEIIIQQSKRDMIHNLYLQYVKYEILEAFRDFIRITKVSLSKSHNHSRILHPEIFFQIKMINLRERILEIESYQLQW